jgi:4-amino-4-deoxy-L-arabinose transferase-like glycosyltransferase
MKNFLKKYWLLILIIVLAVFLRFYNLASYPALNADEASNGYDAYSLIQTGMDQHGRVWPITFQSFNDYKPGLYIYIILPFVKLMGLTAWSVRIPGALLGVLSVLILYFLVRKLFGNHKLAILSSLFLAISPWHLQFSRGGWEVNAATFFILLGILYFLKFLEKPKYLTLSLLFFALSLYAYHAARIISPLLGIILVVIYRKKVFIKENLKPLIFNSLFIILLLIPLVKDLLSPGALSRAAGVGLLADQGPINRIEEQRGEHENFNSILSRAMHNKVVNYGLLFVNNWTSHFNGEFLFMSGDSIERNKVPETGEMYLFDILLLAVGLFAVARKYSQNPKSYSLLLLWLAIAPIASSLTFQAPNALRSQAMVIPMVIISAAGLMELSRILNKKYLKFGIWLLVVGIIWCFGRYLNMYYLHMSKVYPYSSQYGVEELVAYVSKNEAKYQDIFVTGRYDQPYILFLYYMKYDPQLFQTRHTLTVRDEFGFSTVADFDKFHFGAIDFDSVKNNFPGSLIIGTPEEIPDTANIVKKIYGTNGFEYFEIVEN